jgi:hypothetical protein
LTWLFVFPGTIQLINPLFAILLLWYGHSGGKWRI